MTFNTRFSGIERLYGVADSKIIQGMHVCVIGAGGVGSWAIEALARTGVGRITLIDNDEISASNTNRQLHTLTSTEGQSKVGVMAQRVKEINPACSCRVIDDFITLQTYETYLAKDNAYDYVIDAIDSIKFKSIVINYCKRNKIKIITTGAAGGLSDPTAIKVADLTKAYNDPLLAKVRSTLRNEFGFPRGSKRRFGIECIFSSQQQVYPKPDGSISHAKPGIHGVSLDCRFGYGSVSYVTATFGFIAAAQVVNKTLKSRC